MIQFVRPSLLFGTLFLLLGSCTAQTAQSARFDLAGPKVEVRVTRAGKMLPIASVPNFQPGDQLWLHPDLPTTQSVHYLLVAAFLRGTTNPPPDNWFFRIETWDKHVRSEGVTITVPKEAQQAILFLAPETGGDFSTLRSSVRGRPGIFVRASQDLAEAGFEQARIEKYLASIRQVPPSDPKALSEHSALLARTLNLKPNEDCFKRSVDLQYNCLTQTGSQTLLEDGHGQTIVSTLTSGPSTDLINAASTTSLAGGGAYSAYVGAIVDLVKLTSGLHTAHYQYIPAIAFPQQDSLNLRLNTPPSFENPKSVIVIGLPAIQSAAPPPLRPSDPKHVTCLLQPNVSLPVEGAPLVFSTAFAHDLTLHLNGKGSDADLPLEPDAYQGGLILSAARDRQVLGADGLKPDQSPQKQDVTAKRPSAQPRNEDADGAAKQTQQTATISGYWGFDHFTGPTLLVQNVPGEGWKVVADGPQIIAGQENHVLLTSTGVACIQSITMNDGGGEKIKTEWKATDVPNTVNVNLTLKSTNPGELKLDLRQYGKAGVDQIAAQTFARPAELKALELHAGDSAAILSGLNLSEVRKVSVANLTFSPAGSPEQHGGSGEVGAFDTLRLVTAGISGAKPLTSGDALVAKVDLSDGRTLTMPVTIEPARPSMRILSKQVLLAHDSAVHLLNKDDIPLDGQLAVSLRSTLPFPRDARVEISSEDESLYSKLTISEGSLVLQDRNTVLAQLDLRKAFGGSAFGPLRIRLVTKDGTAGDWLPLANLVRLPNVKEMHCPTATDQPCTLVGTDLYLISTISADASFTSPTDVPDGFVGSTLQVPHPMGTTLYMHLRDDASSSSTISLPIDPS